jgi:hypothetical protein
MELKNMKQEEIERVEVYYEQIQKSAHGLQVPTIDSFLTIMFRMGLQSYFKFVIVGIKGSTFQQHMEASILCEERMIIAKARNALFV